MAFTRSFFNLARKSTKPLLAVGGFFYRLVILNTYRLIVTLGNFIKKSLGPIKNKYLVPFINRYVSHLLIIALTATIVYLNYQVKEVKAQQFGEESILFALVRGSDLGNELSTETENPSAKTSANYLDTFDAGRVSSAAAPVNNNIDDSEDTQFDRQAMITQSGGLLGTPIASLSTLKVPRYKIINYTVDQGDTMGEIADNYGLRVATLLWANNLSANSYLRPGQSLVIPPVDGILYTFKKGDTLSSITKKFSGDTETILKFNGLASADELAIGKTIMIPGGKPYAAPPPVQSTRIAKVKDIFVAPKNSGSPDTSAVGFIWPTVTRRLSQYFSWRHTGLDIDGEFGDPIWAAAEGTVITVKYLNYDYGYHVIIDHGGRVNTLYAHFQKIYVTPGQKVAKGDILGEMGSTGRSTGSHLHFEYRVKGSRLNPLNYVSRK